MGIGAEGGFDVGMSEASLDIFDVGTVFNERGGMGMPLMVSTPLEALCRVKYYGECSVFLQLC